MKPENDKFSSDIKISTFEPRSNVSDVHEIRPVAGYDFKLSSSSISIKALYILVLGLGCVFLWSFFVPIDEGVPTSAIVALSEKGKVIQHPTGGVVDRVLVKEGAIVKKGDVLVSLNKKLAQTIYDSSLSSYIALLAADARLDAELKGLDSIPPNAFLKDKAGLPFEKLFVTEEKLFRAKNDNLKNEIAFLNEQIISLTDKKIGLNKQLEFKNSQLKNLIIQITGLANLVADGYAPQNQLLQLKQTESELNSAIVEIESSIKNSENSISEIKIRIKQKKDEVYKESSEKFVEVTRDVQLARERLAAATVDLSRTDITAPVNGQVVGIALASVGGVVGPGQKLMEIVPPDEGLVLEAKIPQHLIDRISKGDDVDIKFTNFSHTPQLIIAGIVSSISNDIITEPSGSGGQQYYLARINVTQHGINTLGNRSLQPGMRADILIKTGKRSLLAYLIHPLRQRLVYVLREQ